MNLKALLARLGPLGLCEPARLREALDGDFMQLRERLQARLKELFTAQGKDDPWPFVRGLFQDAVVVELDGQLWRYPYVLGEGDSLTLGEPQSVVAQYVPAACAGGQPPRNQRQRKPVYSWRQNPRLAEQATSKFGSFARA